MMTGTLRQQLSLLSLKHPYRMSSSNSRREVSGLVPFMAVIVFIAVIVALYVFVASPTSATMQHVAPAAMAPEHTDWKGVIALVLRVILQPTGL
jgi:cytochrome c oxidase assembly factor CtaG